MHAHQRISACHVSVEGGCVLYRPRTLILAQHRLEFNSRCIYSKMRMIYQHSKVEFSIESREIHSVFMDAAFRKQSCEKKTVLPRCRERTQQSKPNKTPYRNDHGFPEPFFPRVARAFVNPIQQEGQGPQHWPSSQPGLRPYAVEETVVA
jgi:hypothetical protein